MTYKVEEELLLPAFDIFWAAAAVAQTPSLVLETKFPLTYAVLNRLRGRRNLTNKNLLLLCWVLRTDSSITSGMLSLVVG